MKDGDLLIDGPKNATATVVLAHGAGAMMDSPFMNTIAEGLAKTGIRVVRFEFPYMRARREGGRRGAPDREAVLLDAWREMASRLGGGGRLVIGGKSMGGRIASMVADELGARGLVCLGYPFHPPGRPVHEASAGVADAGANNTGDARSVRAARRGREIQVIGKDKDCVDRGRRPFVQAARAFGADGGAESRRGDRGG